MPVPAPPLPPAFHRLGWSNLAAQFSEQIALAAAPLAAVLLLAAGPAETGWLQTAQTLPFLLLSIPAGLLVDRAARRALMVGAELVRALSLVLVIGLLAAGALNLPALALLGFLGAVGTVAYGVAAPALVPTLVPRAGLAEANRRLELARAGAYTAGPALGGLLVGWTGVPGAFLLAIALSLAAVGFLSGLPRECAPLRRERDWRRELREGAGFILGHDLLRPILLTAVFFNTGWFVLQAVFVAYAVRDLGLTAAEVGFTLGVYGAGMVGGALVAPVLAHRIAFGGMILIGPVCGFAASLVMLATLWLPAAALACLSFFLFGFGPMLWTISTMTLRQAVTDVALLGRVSAFFMTANFGARPLGAALGAMVAARAGVPACLAVAALLFLIQFAVIVLSRVPALRELPRPA